MFFDLVTIYRWKQHMTVIKNLMHKVFLFAICLAFAVACANTVADTVADTIIADTTPREILVGLTVDSEHPMSIAMQEVFAKTIEDETDGVISVKVFSSGRLGSEQDLYYSVKIGSIQVVTVSPVRAADDYNRMLITTLPFLFRDIDHARKILAGDIGEELADGYNALNNGSVMVGGFAPNIVRSFASDKTLTKPADFEGQSIRITDNEILIQSALLLGVRPITMSLYEVYTAIQMGIIDGQDSGMYIMRLASLYEVQKYIYETNHIIEPLTIIINKDFMDSLSPKQQAIINEAAKATIEYAWDLYLAQAAGDRAYLQEQGLVITQPTAADRAAMQAKMAPLYADFQAKYPWAEKLMDEIRSE
jgi:tripartite ATP-independent transporter DctP family solute receptor